jgi:hypothetical protein
MDSAGGRPACARTPTARMWVRTRREVYRMKDDFVKVEA